MGAIGDFFNTIITFPLGQLLAWIDSFVKNYGLSILVFTVVIKLVLAPLSYKQKKSSMEMAKIRPLQAALQKKYKDDKEKLNTEMANLFKEHGINPAGGCLPVLLQLPILLALYQVVINPMYYMMHLNNDQIAKIAEIVGVPFNPAAATNTQIQIAQAMSTHSSAVLAQFPNIQIVNFNLLGIDLSQTPQFGTFNILWAIPILAAATAYGFSYLTQKLNGQLQPQTKTGGAEDTAAQVSKNMMMFMPLMSGYFCFIMPAGVGIYWIASNLIGMVQEVVLTEYYKRRYGEGQIDANRKDGQKR